MTKPRGKARDSSLEDRKAPDNCLLRTGQPRLHNVMRRCERRHFIFPPAFTARVNARMALKTRKVASCRPS